MPGGQFDARRLDGSRVLALAQHPARRDEARPREGAGPDPDRHIDDGVLDPVPEDGRAQGRGRVLPGQPRLDALQLFRNQAGVRLGQVVADPERPMQLVQRRRPEARIGRRPRRQTAAQIASRRQPRRDHLARPVRRSFVQRRQARRQIPLDPASVGILPAVDPQAARHQPRSGRPGRLAIAPDHRGLAARDPVPGEGACHVTEQLLRLAFVEPGVGAQLPLQQAAAQVDRDPAQGEVGAPALGRGRELVVRRRGRPAPGRHGGRGVGEVALAPPGLRPPAHPFGRGRPRHGRRIALARRRRPRAEQARTAILLIGRGPQRQGGRLRQRHVGPQRSAQRRQIQRRIDRSGRRPAHRDIAVAQLALHRPGQGEPAGAQRRRRRQPPAAVFAARDVQRPAVRVPLAQLDHPGQGARAIGAGSGAANDVQPRQALRRDLGPQHPAAERIVQRHAVQGHQGPPGPRRRDGAQGNALGRRIGGQARGAPEQAHRRHGLQGLVQPRRPAQHLLVQTDHREGGVSRGGRQAGGGDDDVGKIGGEVLEHADRILHFAQGSPASNPPPLGEVARRGFAP